MITDLCVREAGTKGQGVFALRDFRPGEFIYRSKLGRVVSRAEVAGLSEDERRHLNELDWDTYEIMTAPGCYVNHSCDPNTIGKGQSIHAWKPIRAGEEITSEYRIGGVFAAPWPCACGSANYPGYVVGDFFSLDQELQRRYLPYAPRFIRQEYKRRHTPGRS